MTYVTYVKNNTTAKKIVLEHYDFEDTKNYVSNIDLEKYRTITHVYDNERNLVDIIDWNDQ